jgi:hypothetical protein
VVLYRIHTLTKADTSMNRIMENQNLLVLISSLMYTRNWSKRSTPPIYFLCHLTKGQIETSFSTFPFLTFSSPALADTNVEQHPLVQAKVGGSSRACGLHACRTMLHTHIDHWSCILWSQVFLQSRFLIFLTVTFGSRPLLLVLTVPIE